MNFCPWLLLPTHGSLSTFQTEYQTVVDIKCKVGYITTDLNTTKTVECLDTQQWNDSYSNCTGNRNVAAHFLFIKLPYFGSECLFAVIHI